MKKFTSTTQKKGEIGEMVVCTYLSKKGFEVIERNFTKKWGEIDVIAQKDGEVHFIEVKSVTCEMSESKSVNISHETPRIRPEEQMTLKKQRRLRKTIETYIVSHGIGNWCFDVACVYLDMVKRRARVKILDNIILQWGMKND